MQRTKITESYSVSEQISLEDVDVLASEGVDLIICNRPDNEGEDQLNFAEVAARAAEKGIAAVHVPFVGGQMTANDVELFKKALVGAQNVHAYCRTGNRSSKIWEAAQTPSSTAAAADYDVVIVGAGSAGAATAASVKKRRPDLKICLIDPAEKHYYQPGWTLVGGGVFDVKTTEKSMASVIPAGTTWLKEAVASFEPEVNAVVLANGSRVTYKFLVVTPGLTLNWGAIEGLTETLGSNGVTSNYRFDLAPYTWELVKGLKKGKAVFTQPPMPIKCAGAPQKAMYLSCSHWFKENVLGNIEVQFRNAGAVLFGVAAYVPALEKYVEKYNIDLNFGNKLVKVDGPNKKAYFEVAGTDGKTETVETDFDMLHVCPPQCAPEFIRKSPLVDESGWVDVDPETLQHKKYANIWSLGDVVNTTNAKTMAAARKQAPVVAQNICDAYAGKGINAIYNGYGSCPLTVEHGKIVLAEFGYGGKLLPTFPEWFNDGTKPTRFGWILKERLLPPFYWYGMLKGYEWYVKPEMRKK